MACQTPTSSSNWSQIPRVRASRRPRPSNVASILSGMKASPCKAFMSCSYRPFGSKIVHKISSIINATTVTYCVNIWSWVSIYPKIQFAATWKKATRTAACRWRFGTGISPAGTTSWGHSLSGSRSCRNKEWTDGKTYLFWSECWIRFSVGLFFSSIEGINCCPRRKGNTSMFLFSQMEKTGMKSCDRSLRWAHPNERWILFCLL